MNPEIVITKTELEEMERSVEAGAVTGLSERLIRHIRYCTLRTACSWCGHVSTGTTQEEMNRATSEHIMSCILRPEMRMFEYVKVVVKSATGMRDLIVKLKECVLANPIGKGIALDPGYVNEVRNFDCGALPSIQEPKRDPLGSLDTIHGRCWAANQIIAEFRFGYKIEIYPVASSKRARIMIDRRSFGASILDFQPSVDENSRMLRTPNWMPELPFGSTVSIAIGVLLDWVNTGKSRWEEWHWLSLGTRNPNLFYPELVDLATRYTCAPEETPAS